MLAASAKGCVVYRRLASLKASIYSVLRVPIKSLEEDIVAPLSLKRALGIILALPALYLIRRLNYNRYCDTRTSRKLSLSVDNKLRLVYLDIDTIAE